MSKVTVFLSFKSDDSKSRIVYMKYRRVLYVLSLTSILSFTSCSNGKVSPTPPPEDEYEVIEIESYDPKTNTITFKTKSFSNYAIATKTSSVDNNGNNSSKNQVTASTKSNPQTSDNITTYFITLLLSVAGLTGAGLIVNKRRKFARN